MQNFQGLVLYFNKDSVNVTELFEELVMLIMSAFNETFPIKLQCRRKSRNKPRFDKESSELLRRRRLLQKLRNKTGREEDKGKSVARNKKCKRQIQTQRTI